jgi:hypothetical protein
MTDYEIHPEIERPSPDIGDRVRDVTVSVINEFSPLPADEVAGILHHRLEDIGVEMSEEACLSAIEKVRSGKHITFEVD